MPSEVEREHVGRVVGYGGHEMVLLVEDKA